jgi:hypothetical protein
MSIGLDILLNKLTYSIEIKLLNNDYLNEKLSILLKRENSILSISS